MLEVFSRVMVALFMDKVADMTLSSEQRSLCRMTSRVAKLVSAGVLVTGVTEHSRIRRSPGRRVWGEVGWREAR